MFRKAASVTLVLLLGACVTQAPVFDAGTPCKTASFTVVDGFGGARRGRCEVVAADHVRLSIRPEDAGYINPSPWYSFQLDPFEATTAVISLHYTNHKHRYIPKISTDSLSWSALDEKNVQVSDDGSLATIIVPLGTDAVWVSAQELVMPAIYEVWTSHTAERTDAELELLGYSMAEQPIRYLVSNPSAKDVLFLVGRQHPPEVSGAFAFFSFTETLLANTEVARRFRTQFQIIAIPLLNPDGVLDGNWRHNRGSTDLNRDWGVFKQPETRMVGELLDRLDAEGKRIRVFLDFHSTDRNVFYTQDETVPTDPPNFFERWFSRAAPRLSDYAFTNDAGPGENPVVGKNYMYRRYGVPSATYEVGDETDREAARQAAAVFAEELMGLMLETLAESR
ncbi:MAG: succinylglutamate desuccinylase/aspartoacylase family protein [Gammaproteobacteria bacterium]|nr:succinylglutamate desuccinylase/aspartoacylase family protein [Gammaproteobacteria bacterium]